MMAGPQTSEQCALKPPYLRQLGIRSLQICMEQPLLNLNLSLLHEVSWAVVSLEAHSP